MTLGLISTFDPSRFTNAANANCEALSSRFSRSPLGSRWFYVTELMIYQGLDTQSDELFLLGLSGRGWQAGQQEQAWYISLI